MAWKAGVEGQRDAEVMVEGRALQTLGPTSSYGAGAGARQGGQGLGQGRGPGETWEGGTGCLLWETEQRTKAVRGICHVCGRNTESHQSPHFTNTSISLPSRAQHRGPCPRASGSPPDPGHTAAVPAHTCLPSDLLCSGLRPALLRSATLAASPFPILTAPPALRPSPRASCM